MGSNNGRTSKISLNMLLSSLAIQPYESGFLIDRYLVQDADNRGNLWMFGHDSR